MVAYTFQQYKLGELIGAKTEGAANVSDDFAVAPAFRLSISTGRTVQPISRGDWEGVGVAPTVLTDPAHALEVAQLRAIDRLLPATPEGVPRFQLAWAKPAIEAALHPAILSEMQLRQFAGEFGDVIEEESITFTTSKASATQASLKPRTSLGSSVSSIRSKASGSLDSIQEDDPSVEHEDSFHNDDSSHTTQSPKKRPRIMSSARTQASAASTLGPAFEDNTDESDTGGSSSF